jgi:hypothetical protein
MLQKKSAAKGQADLAFVYTALMKSKCSVVTALVTVVGLLSLSACTSAPRDRAAGEGAARIHSISGNADVARGNGPFEPAHLWQKLRSGDRARTAGNGKIDFSLGKFGGVLTLMPESMITFEQLGPVPADSPILAVLNLTEGRVVGDTLKLPPGKRIQIKTAGGTHEIP